MSAHFANMADFWSWLDDLGMFHMDFGLERMRSALRALNLENPPCQVVQVLGTNGKGSTCAFLASLARTAGLDTGLYTSPHFISPKERILLNGRQAEDQLWLEAANEIRGAYPGALTWFEFVTLLALLIFKKAGVKLAIFEAGLGGGGDATTAIRADAQCFTPIAMDHAHIIGPSIEAIARDKAAAMRAPSFSAPQYPLARAMLRAQAAQKGLSLVFVEPLPAALPCGLAGAHQRINAALALAAWLYLHPHRPDWDQIATALASAFLPGRLQLCSGKNIILDGAHNPHGMANLARECPEAGAVIFSSLADKDWRATLGILARRFPAAPLFIPEMANPRAMDVAAMTAFYDNLQAGKAIACAGSYAFRRALAIARQAMPEGLILITGSLYLLAEFYALFPQYLDHSRGLQNG